MSSEKLPAMEKRPNEPPAGGNERKIRLKNMDFPISSVTEDKPPQAAPLPTQEILIPWGSMRLPTPTK